MNFIRYGQKILAGLNKLLPKYNQVLVIGNTIIDPNAVEIANYSARNLNLKVYYYTSKKFTKNTNDVLDSEVILIGSKLSFVLKLMTSKYVFFTYADPLHSLSRRQVMINIYHGVLYKTVRKLRGEKGIPATLTVGTSEITKKMFADAFGVSRESVFISGYPRNDIMLRSHKNKNVARKKFNEGLNSFDKLILWMPTYRKKIEKNKPIDGKQYKNPFNIDDFDVNQFNELLKSHNSICLIKQHPVAVKMNRFKDLSNINFINDEAICYKGITLYDLIGSSDILISDFSSIIIDYLLLDQPILCASSDLKEYQDTRGFYFEDIENWLPSKVLSSQKDLFESLSSLLSTGRDPYTQKRKKLKDEFFTFKDANSTFRLMNRVFSE